LGRDAYSSWNRVPVFHDQATVKLRDRDAPLPRLSRPFIAYGNGRSYGDVCLNEGGYLLDTRGLDKFISFDRDAGRLCCEAGVLLSDILDLVVPQGWFLPVTPGTRYITLGGAIANDVHGKNHHVAGSFGQHVRRLALRRSDGELIICGPDVNPEWFGATVGGLGLTGIILWAEIDLIPIESDMMAVRTERFRHLDEFWALSEVEDDTWPYTVAWVDCMSATGRGSIRGAYFSGRHATVRSGRNRSPRRSWRLAIDPPFSLIGTTSARLFNAAYFLRAGAAREGLAHYREYFYPLDGVRDWNRVYGPKGFFQYQCVLPFPDARVVLASILQRIAASGEACFLAVLKTFGGSSPVGLLSFPRPGVTLAVDFPNRGRSTLRLLEDLDALVSEASGALYPAKDARMPAGMFRQGFPQLDQFVRHVDPMASSSFWRRVGN